jgi:homoserine kinase
LFDRDFKLESGQMTMTAFQVRLPATSANLGPGFDAAGLAMQLYLNVRASVAETFAIEASGRDVALVGSLERNLMVETYRDLLPDGPALHLTVKNEIPLGMGCGSSAAALLAGVMLANHFGELGLSPEALLAEACRREGHPDNVAACFHGGLTLSAMDADGVTAATLGTDLPWRLLVAIPGASLATSEARALLPDTYPRQDVVENVQATALLVAAFALGRPELLAQGTRDRMHQPYRSRACPLLPALLPLAGTPGVYSVTLSGAGPSVLLIVDAGANLEDLVTRVRAAAGDPDLEVIATSISGGAWDDQVTESPIG